MEIFLTKHFCVCLLTAKRAAPERSLSPPPQSKLGRERGATTTLGPSVLSASDGSEPGSLLARAQNMRLSASPNRATSLAKEVSTQTAVSAEAPSPGGSLLARAQQMRAASRRQQDAVILFSLSTFFYYLNAHWNHHVPLSLFCTDPNVHLTSIIMSLARSVFHSFVRFEMPD